MFSDLRSFQNDISLHAAAATGPHRYDGTMTSFLLVMVHTEQSLFLTLMNKSALSTH